METVSPVFSIRPLAASDRQWVEQLLSDHWGSTLVVSRGRLHDAASLPGFAAIGGSGPSGLLTYQVKNGQCEIITLNSLAEGIGAGSALIKAVAAAARQAGCRRLWLVTTNDNLAALRFYQKRGFRIAAVHPNAIEHSRQLKPEIPATGNDGIPIRDEIEMEMAL